METGIAAKELEPNRDITMRSVIAHVVDTDTIREKSTIQTNTQQHISEDYAVPEEIASEALLMLQTMSQPNPQELEDNDDYALPVGTERLPDIISKINEERGIKTVVNYDAEIPEEMRLQMEEPKKGTHEEGGKDEESDETIIYDASEFEQLNMTHNKQTEK